jgi:PKD repeat protein
VTTSHTYGSAGTFQVKLTVTDNKGATTVTQSPVTVTAPAVNEPPVAAFTSSATNLKVSVDGTGSSDPDGTVSSYAWDFGDGGTATTATATHTYTTAGTHQITLKVTDNKGTSTSLTQPVQTQQAANVPPVALFTSTTSNLTANLNAGDANDPDGTISSYAWDFGDSATGSGATTAHTYGAGGTYQVKLTVTDNSGAATSVVNPVTVAPAPAAVLASDQFARTVASGWGAADQGGAWTLDGSTPNFLVGGGVGTIKMAAAGSGKAVWLNGVSQRDVDTTVDFSLDKAATGGGTTVSIAARRIGTSDYRLRVRANAGGSVVAELTRVINGAETAIATQTVSGLTYNVGDTLRMRFQVSGTGTATLQGKVWKVGGTEPAAWQVSKTDTTAGLQAAGGIGLVTYVSGSATNAPVAASFDNLTVKAIQ